MTTRRAAVATRAVRDFRPSLPPTDPLIVVPGASWAFVVAGNPVPKERPRVVRGGTYTPMRTLAAEHAISTAARLAGCHPTHAPIWLSVRFYRSTHRRCDLDNLAKTVLDALNGVAYADDSQVIQLEAYKFVDAANPRTEVTVREVEA